MTATVELELRTDEEALQYLEQLWPRYREELIRSGTSEAEADANIGRNQQAIAPDGVLAPGQFMFRVLKDGQHIGNLWLCPRDDNGDWFIYDIEVFEQHQGQGLGRATMQLAEEYARSHGATRLGLSVFGFNTVARALYESLGYSIVAMGMTKDLGQDAPAG